MNNINIVNKTEDKASCKVTINAKGVFSGCEVKSYADTLDNAKVEALRVAKELQMVILKSKEDYEKGKQDGQ